MPEEIEGGASKAALPALYKDDRSLRATAILFNKDLIYNAFIYQ